MASAVCQKRPSTPNQVPLGVHCARGATGADGHSAYVNTAAAAPTPAPTKPIVLKVRAKGKEGEVRFFGDEAGPMATSIKTDDLGLKLHVSAQVIDLAELRAQLEPSKLPNGGKISLLSDLAGQGQIVFDLPHRYSLDAHLRGRLKAMPGVLYFEDV